MRASTSRLKLGAVTSRPRSGPGTLFLAVLLVILEIEPDPGAAARQDLKTFADIIATVIGTLPPLSLRIEIADRARRLYNFIY